MIDNVTRKNTSIGLIPTDWEVMKLSDVSKVIMGQSPDSKNYFNYEIGLPLLQGNADIKDRKSIKRIWTNQITKVCEENDIVMSVRAPVGTIAKASFKSCIGRGICSIQSNELIIKQFLYSYLEKYETNWTRLSQGSTFESINKDDIKLLKIPIPPLPEQQKIATILSTWDNAIDTTMKILRNLEIIKKGMTINILSGKIRFETFSKDNKISQRNGYKIPDDWEIKNLSSVLEQIKKPVKPEKDILYKQLGIRSHTKGIFYKESVTGQSLGNKSVFAIEPDCFILNIVFAWEHAIAKTSVAELDMIVSHRFPMYKPLASKLDLDYLLFFFKSKKGKDLLGLASPGGAGRNKTLGQKEFLKLKIPIPPIKEQKAIAVFLETYDSEIKLHQQKLQALQLQKKGLMQQLLTGKVRVKTNN